MENLKLSILKHLDKIGAHNQRMDITDFLNSKVKNDEHYFVVNNILLNLYKEKAIDCQFGHKQITREKSIPGLRFDNTRAFITSQGQAVVKAFCDGNHDKRHKNFSLALNIISIIVAILFGFLAYNGNEKNKELENKISIQDSIILKLQDTIKTQKQIKIKNNKALQK